MDSTLIEKANDLTKSCLLPTLKQNLESGPLQPEDFIEFRKLFHTNCTLLLHLIAQNASPLLESHHELEEFHVNLLLVLCEQTIDGSLFQTKDKHLLEDLKQLAKRLLVTLKTATNNNVEQKLLQYYKCKLTKTLWLTNLGAIYGFTQFCQIYYTDQNITINLSDSLFLLSIGTILAEFYEEQFKQFGINIFLCLLNQTVSADVLASNLHEAIYSTCMACANTLRQPVGIHAVWMCLLKCAEIGHFNSNVSKWNRTDEMIGELLTKITFANKDKSILFLFLSKLMSIHCVKTTANVDDDNDEFSLIVNATNITTIRWQIDEMFKNSQIKCWNYNRLRSECQSHDKYSIYRWLKKLLTILMHSELNGIAIDEMLFDIHAIHVCFLVCVFGVNTCTLVSHEFSRFFSEFPSILLRTLKRFKYEPIFVNEIVEIFQTLVQHIEINLCELNDESKLLWNERCEQLNNIRDIVLNKSNHHI